MRRRRVCEKLALVPGKLDHATVAAYSVANRKKALQAYSGKYRLHVSFVSNGFNFYLKVRCFLEEKSPKTLKVHTNPSKFVFILAKQCRFHFNLTNFLQKILKF